MRSFVFNRKRAGESFSALLIALAIFVIAGCATTGLDTADTSPGDEGVQEQGALDKQKPAGELKVRSIEVLGEGDNVLIATNRTAEYTAFTLTSPSRLVIDLPDANLYDVLDTIRVNNQFLKTINVVTYGGKEKIGRIILELQDGVDHDVSSAEEGVLIRLRQDPLAGMPEGSLDNGGDTVVVAATSDAPLDDRPTTDEEVSSPEPMDPATIVENLKSFTEDTDLVIQIVSDGAIGKYNTFELSDPSRVVIDVWDVSNKTGLKVLRIDGRDVKDVRVGNHPDKVRFVIDLNGEEIPHYVVTRSGDHLAVAFGEAPALAESDDEIASDTGDDGLYADVTAEENVAEADTAVEVEQTTEDDGSTTGLSNVAYDAGDVAVAATEDVAAMATEEVTAAATEEVAVAAVATEELASTPDVSAALDDGGESVAAEEDAVDAPTDEATVEAVATEEAAAVTEENVETAVNNGAEADTSEVAEESPEVTPSSDVEVVSNGSDGDVQEAMATADAEIADAVLAEKEAASEVETALNEGAAEVEAEPAEAVVEVQEEAPVEVARNEAVAEAETEPAEPVVEAEAEAPVEVAQNEAVAVAVAEPAEPVVEAQEEAPVEVAQNEEAATAEAEPVEPVAEAPATRPAPIISAGNNIRDIEYKKVGEKGFLTIKTTTKPVYTIKESKDGRTLVLDINDALIGENLVRTLDATKLGTTVASISSYQGSTDPALVRILIALSTVSTHSVMEGDGTLNLVFAPVAKPAALDSTVKTADAIIGNSRAYTGKKIDIDMMDARITDILRLLAEVSNLNIIASDDVTGTISLRLRDVPWDQAFDIILKSKGLDKIKVGNVIRVAPASRISQERDAALAAVKASEKLEPLDIEFVAINYAKAEDLEEHVKNVLSARGSVTSEKRTNTLIIKDIKKGISAAQRLVSRLDTPIPQVLIEARIVEASSSFSRDLGIQWGVDYQTGGNVNANIFGSGVDSTGLPAPGQTPPSGSNPTFATRNGAQNFAVNLPATGSIGTLGALGFILGKAGQNPLVLDLRLSAGEQEGQLRTISRPRVVTMDNKEAKIEDGESVPFETTSASGTSTIFIDANLSLTVTPHITPDGSVLMKIKASKNSIGTFTTSSGEPSIVKKEASTEVLVSDGETTVIGGIISSDSNHTDSGIPYLKDIPLVGKLFRSKSTKESQKELLIFITPTIMKTKRTG